MIELATKVHENEPRYELKFKTDNPEFYTKMRKFAKALLDNKADTYLELPCKIGDYIEWFNGISSSLHRVNGFIDDGDGLGLRYILDICAPTVSHPNIENILSKEEVENYELYRNCKKTR